MDYEKKYKEALEWMQSLYDGLHGATKEDAEHYFPELKESEDERIRREIIDFLRLPHPQFVGKRDHELWIAWLEKNKRKFEESEMSITESQPEPKFKVGDWVVNNVCFPMQIASIKDGMYIFTKGDAMSVLFIDGNFHLWTIHDAMDGDVLCYHVPATAFFLIGIFKRVANKDELWGGTYRNYAQYGGYGSIENYTLQVALGNDELHHCGSIVCPATKEQRDWLFSKMKEAGYEWDSEKKELKKIEAKSLDASTVIEWLKETIRETVEDCGIYRQIRLTLPYNSIEDFISDFKEDFGL